MLLRLKGNLGKNLPGFTGVSLKARKKLSTSYTMSQLILDFF